MTLWGDIVGNKHNITPSNISHITTNMVGCKVEIKKDYNKNDKQMV